MSVISFSTASHMLILIRNNLFYDIRKYCKSFKNLSDEDLIAFFFNSVDPVICKKMSHFLYEASLRRDDLLIRNL